jgi:exodeoxyribonuclease VII large subunit
MPTEAAITVSQLNRRVKTLLEQGIERLWVEGEISNLSKPSSGHIYFTLKDDSAQVSAAWFRQRQRGPAIGFKNGDKVLACGRVSLYEPRGSYQLIVEQMEAAGEGVLKQRFEALKRKLLAEGLFDEDRKRPLPTLPARIGVITSPSGAAIRDIVTVLGRRFPAVPVVIYPAAVQGEAAPGELLAALSTAIRRAECDVLIIGRGGGSLEDLWAFNDEALARAIAECPIPVVSAVGHEVDFTIWLGRRLVTASPARTLLRQRDQLRESRGRLASAMRHQLLERRGMLQSLRSDLLQQSPALSVQRAIAALATLRQRLGAAAKDRVSRADRRLAVLGRTLHSVSPLATLDRGYAIVQDARTGRALLRAGDVAAGDEILARLAEGRLVASVTKVIEDD